MQCLDGAYQRVARSSEHLADLKVMVSNFEGSPNVVTGISYVEAEKAIHKILAEHHESDFGPVPARVSVLVGECIYNLRSALDYLIYELACLDAKQIVEGTQFPIEDSGKAFVSRIGSVCDTRHKGVYLRGINDIHVAMISWLQPCYGCNWTRILREISNPDKHMHLIVLKTPFGVSANIQADPNIPKDSVKVNYQLTFYVAFGDGRPIIDTLQDLHLSVSAVINFFKAEFT